MDDTNIAEIEERLRLRLFAALPRPQDPLTAAIRLSLEPVVQELARVLAEEVAAVHSEARTAVVSGR
jgi:hypothetical protein